jgi:multimeric flavodoxin WrbA
MKILLINGSPNKAGCTGTALKLVADAAMEAGAQTEIFHIPNKPLRGCAGCFVCKRRRNDRCVFEDDCVNDVIEKAERADAFIFGTPVYFSGPTGQLLCVMDRAFFASRAFSGKPAAAICSARRAGTTATIEVLNQFFYISRMPLVTSSYWPMVHGVTPEDVLKDEEGVQAMRFLGRNTVRAVRALEAEKAAGLEAPAMPEGKKIWTNFIPDGNTRWEDFLKGQ